MTHDIPHIKPMGVDRRMISPTVKAVSWKQDFFGESGDLLCLLLLAKINCCRFFLNLSNPFGSFSFRTPLKLNIDNPKNANFRKGDTLPETNSFATENGWLEE